MAREIEANYEQTFMLPPCLEDWVPAGHPARFVRDFVDQLDLKALGFKERKGPAGAPRYSNGLLVKVWLYGYFEGLDSTRKLEKACLDRVGFIWLTGQHYPDHNTLWRFWHNNQKALQNLFLQAVKVGVKLDLVGMVLHAVDGTRIQSAASSAKGLYKKKLTKALSRVEDAIEEYMRRVKDSGQPHTGEYESQLPAELQDAQRRKQQIQSALEELQSHGASSYHPGDPDAEVVRCDRGLRFGYNAQAVADEKTGLVVAAEVCSQSGDKGLLTPMLKKTRENLGEVAKTTVADGGYNTDCEVAEAASLGCEVLVSEHGQEKKGPLSPDKFTYDEERDTYQCPLGHELSFCGEDRTRTPPRRRYRCRNYKNCPMRWKCSKAKNGKMIVRSPFAQAVQEHNRRRDLPENRTKLKKRKAIIEHIFGWVKQNMHRRRWSACGLSNARTEWLMLCTTWNLKLIYRKWLNQKFPKVPMGKGPLGPKRDTQIFPTPVWATCAAI